MTKKSPKVFLINMGIKPNNENMAKFYKHSRTISEIKAGRPYIDDNYHKEVLSFRETTVQRRPKKTI